MNVVEACESIAEQVLITKYILKSEAPLDRDEVARFLISIKKIEKNVKNKKLSTKLSASVILTI